MDCKEFRKISEGYLADAVPSELRAQVKEHLDRCPICAAIVRRMQALREGLRLALCKDCCPDNLRQRVSRRLKVASVEMCLTRFLSRFRYRVPNKSKHHSNTQ